MGKFVVKAAKSGIMFNLVATNGQVIATSEIYSSEDACLHGVDVVREIAADAPIENQTIEGFVEEKCPKFEVYQDKAGEYRFRLKAKNGQIVAVSESYKAKKSCMGGIASVKKNAPEGKIVKA